MEECSYLAEGVRVLVSALLQVQRRGLEHVKLAYSLELAIA
jgi:hypothetical protein